MLLRSSVILEQLEESRLKNKQRNVLKKTEAKPVYQMNMFQTEDPVLKQLKESLGKLDINTMSPIDALLALQKIKGIIPKD